MSETMKEKDVIALVKTVPDKSLFVVTVDLIEDVKAAIKEERPNSNLEIKVVSTAEEVLAIVYGPEGAELEEVDSTTQGDIVFLFSEDNEELHNLDLFEIDEFEIVDDSVYSQL